MALQDNGLEFLDGFAYRVRLAQDVNAILIFFYHSANACHVSLYLGQAFQHIASTFILHVASSRYFPRKIKVTIKAVVS